ncbi:MAG: hypothetical protein EPO23_05280 [Xanthobacteraceae bacterium]|nr:MAG: hypothetical protein EPO23_05280 [Xanthobacteraceae bacterium]
MSHDAFALSPIAARATEPGEADYAAICEAFMETARGRWFLGEYARRNRNADTRMVLDAVARIEETLARQKRAPAPDRADAIAATVMEARRRAMAALATDDAEQAQRAIRNAAQMIRDMSWTLRECGADARVCNLLDAQVAAIDGGCDRHGTPLLRHDSMIAVFDELAAKLQALVRGEPAAEAAAAPTPEPPPALTPHADPLSAGVPEADADVYAGMSKPTAAPADAGINAVEIVADAAADVLADRAPEPVMQAAEPVAVADAARPATEEVASPAPRSLGAALLNSGVIAAPPARRDPLAPLRKLSQAEKIALFS